MERKVDQNKLRRELIAGLEDKAPDIQAAATPADVQQIVDQVTQEAIETAESPLSWDEWIYRIAVGALAVVMVLAVIAYLWMGLAGKDVSEALVAMGAGSLGALAGLLTPRSQG